MVPRMNEWSGIARGSTCCNLVLEESDKWVYSISEARRLGKVAILACWPVVKDQSHGQIVDALHKCDPQMTASVEVLHITQSSIDLR